MKQVAALLMGKVLVNNNNFQFFQFLFIFVPTQQPKGQLQS
jgi:hypothetical protein